MTTANLPLDEGDELLCPHCRRWHPVTAQHSEGTNYTQAMLYWRCAKGVYYHGTARTSESASNAEAAESGVTCHGQGGEFPKLAREGRAGTCGA
jgi:hypothetical protein